MFLRNKINFVTLKSRFGGTRSRFPRNGYIRQLGETSWGPPGRKLCYVKSHFGGTRSRFPRNGYIRQSGESCRVEARQGETSRGPLRLATNESTPQLASCSSLIACCVRIGPNDDNMRIQQEPSSDPQQQCEKVAGSDLAIS